MNSSCILQLWHSRPRIHCKSCNAAFPPRTPLETMFLCVARSVEGRGREEAEKAGAGGKMQSGRTGMRWFGKGDCQPSAITVPRRYPNIFVGFEQRAASSMGWATGPLHGGVLFSSMGWATGPLHGCAVLHLSSSSSSSCAFNDRPELITLVVF